MITRSEYEAARRRAVEFVQRAGVLARPDELDRIEVADLGLSELEQSGVQILTLLQTENVGVKLLILFPHQTEPEHRHPPLGDYPGKEETLRGQWGTLYLYLPGDPTPNPLGHPPAHRRDTYTCWREVVLEPGDQITISPGTPHWFQGGPEGAVVWTMSSRVSDVQDIFTDPEVQRQTVIVEDTV